MSQYFSEPYSCSGKDVETQIDLYNYAKKKKLKLKEQKKLTYQ